MDIWLLTNYVTQSSIQLFEYIICNYSYRFIQRIFDTAIPDSFPPSDLGAAVCYNKYPQPFMAIFARFLHAHRHSSLFPRLLTLVWANLTGVTSPPNSTAIWFPFYLFLNLLLYFLFIFYLPQHTLTDFLSDSSLASLSFLSCCQRTTAS